MVDMKKFSFYLVVEQLPNAKLYLSPLEMELFTLLSPCLLYLYLIRFVDCSMICKKDLDSELEGNYRPCIRKCPEVELSQYNASIPNDDTFLIVGNDTSSTHLLSNFTLLQDELNCIKYEALDPTVKDDEFLITREGNIYLPLHDEIMDYNEYCIGDLGNATLKVLICYFEDSPIIEAKSDSIAILILLMASTVCLLLTFIAIIATPVMRNLHGKNLACQSFTLMVGFIGLAAICLSGKELRKRKTACKIIGYITYLFIMSSFFWLNAMCFDVFWTFRTLKKLTGTLLSTHQQKFIIYSIYSTVFPVLMSILLVIFDNTLSEGILHPGFGVDTYSGEGYAEIIFMQAPVLFLLLENVIFFIIALSRITYMRKTSRRELKMTNSNRHEENGDRQSIALCLKLFVLMGGTWLMESISWWFNSKPDWLFVPFDLINASRGVLIFILCILLNPKMRGVIGKCKPGLPLHSSADTTSSSNATRHQMVQIESESENCLKRNSSNESPL